MLTLVSSVLAITITAVFIWYVVTHRTNKVDKEHCNEEHASADVQKMAACPQLPTLFPIPKPTPKRIAEGFEKLELTLSGAIDKNSSLPAISMNVFYQDEILWRSHFGSKEYQQPKLKPNDTTIYRIGSVTKIFPVLLMFKLYVRGGKNLLY